MVVAVAMPTTTWLAMKKTLEDGVQSRPRGEQFCSLVNETIQAMYVAHVGDAINPPAEEE